MEIIHLDVLANKRIHFTSAINIIGIDYRIISDAIIFYYEKTQVHGRAYGFKINMVQQEKKDERKKLNICALISGQVFAHQAIDWSEDNISHILTPTICSNLIAVRLRMDVIQCQCNHAILSSI